MRTIPLLIAASLALTAPVLAQTGDGQMGQGQMNQQSAQGEKIDHTQLNRDQIRQLQMNLNKAGFDARSVDGIWGENTRSALRNYQQSKNLPGNGQLNQQTLSELGVQFAGQQGQGQGGAAATGAGAGEGSSPSGQNAGQGGGQQAPANEPGAPDKGSGAK